MSDKKNQGGINPVAVVAAVGVGMAAGVAAGAVAMTDDENRQKVAGAVDNAKEMVENAQDAISDAKDTIEEEVDKVKKIGQEVVDELNG